MHATKRNLVNGVQDLIVKTKEAQSRLHVHRGAEITIKDADGRPRYLLDGESNLVWPKQGGRPIDVARLRQRNLLAVHHQLKDHLEHITQ